MPARRGVQEGFLNTEIRFGDHIILESVDAQTRARTRKNTHNSGQDTVLPDQPNNNADHRDYAGNRRQVIERRQGRTLVFRELAGIFGKRIFVELLPGTAVDEELERGVEQSTEQHHNAQVLRHNLGARRIIRNGGFCGSDHSGGRRVRASAVSGIVRGAHRRVSGVGMRGGIVLRARGRGLHTGSTRWHGDRGGVISRRGYIWLHTGLRLGGTRVLNIVSTRILRCADGFSWRIVKSVEGYRVRAFTGFRRLVRVRDGAGCVRIW